MLYFKIKNYEEFKENFGIRNNTRKNNILLSFLKHEMRQKREVPKINNLSDMYCHILKIAGVLEESDINIMGFHFKSDIYKTDDRDGLCGDGDIRSIRYVRKEDGRLFKMKAGKFLRKILLDNERTSDFCEQAIIYTCESFSTDWTAYAASKQEDVYKLVVDDDFSLIYNPDVQAGGFNSCMNNKGYENFYSDYVDAQAASLWKNDVMVARCVIFTNVYVKGSEIGYRLAERQYAWNEDNTLKQILVNKLIEGDYIDGYKKVGASCHDPRLFILNDGTSLSDKVLFINSYGDATEADVPYMDTFKYYDEDNKEFYNAEFCKYTHKAENTDGTMDYCQEFDSYHECYCDEVRSVYVWNRYGEYERMFCDVDRLDDFAWCVRNGEYYSDCQCSWYENDYIPKDECVYSRYLDDWLFSDNAMYSEEMEDYLPESEYDKILEEWLAECEAV